MHIMTYELGKKVASSAHQLLLGQPVLELLELLVKLCLCSLVEQVSNPWVFHVQLWIHLCTDVDCSLSALSPRPSFAK